MSRKNTLNTEQRRELRDRMSAINDEVIDLSEPRALPDDAWKKARPLKEMFRPIKEPIALRVDADVLQWLRSQKGPYQTRINAILREAMKNSRHK
jgi:uncharacterized protein (DUF4415 family)